MKLKMFLHWIEEYDGKMTPLLFGTDMTKYDYICAGEVEAEIPDCEPPSKSDITKSKVQTLRAKQGEHQHEIDKIEEAVQQLLCIEYKPEVVDTNLGSSKGFDWQADAMKNGLAL